MSLLEKLLRRTSASQEDFVQACYELLLGRSADPAGLAAYLARLADGRIEPAGIMREMAASEEYRRTRAAYDYRLDPDLEHYREQLDEGLTGQLEACGHLSEPDYQACWDAVFTSGRELVIGQAEYGAQHRRRFFELCNALGVLLHGLEAPRVLEIGVSEYSGLYRRLYPQLALDCADRPVPGDYAGFTPQRIQRVADPGKIFSIDLNRPADAQLHEARGCYDLVLFTEVLEHLVANPTEVLQLLLPLLRPQGFIYLTTPNFFRRENRSKMAAWDNPQEIYPAADGNWDLHYHYREYGHRELFRFIRDAGAVVRAFHFSACWDDPLDVPKNRAEWGNMVFVIQSGTPQTTLTGTAESAAPSR